MIKTLTGKDNPTLKEFRKLASAKKHRTQSGLYVCEGKKLFCEAIRYKQNVTCAVWEQSALDSMSDESKECLRIAEDNGCRIISVDESLYKSISTLENYMGVVFTCEIPNMSVPVTAGRGYLALDGVQDPGNVGTILRTADAFGISVFLLEGCADVFNPKTVRATMGSLFRVPFEYITAKEYLEKMKNAGISVYATALKDTSRDLSCISLKNASVVIGSEGNGVSKEMLDSANGHVILPMKGETESLNAAIAASIVMWEMSKVCQ